MVTSDCEGVCQEERGRKLAEITKIQPPKSGKSIGLAKRHFSATEHINYSSAKLLLKRQSKRAQPRYQSGVVTTAVALVAVLQTTLANKKARLYFQRGWHAEHTHL